MGMHETISNNQEEDLKH